LRALIGAQLILLAVVAVGTAFSFSRFTLDERAHFAYVESVATDLSIPEVGVDLVSPSIAAVHEGTYPAPPRVPPARQGLGGQSYEGFQPPLYYAVAVPAFELAGGDYQRKLRVVRLFNVLLLAGTVLLLWLLVRRVAGPDGSAQAMFALALTVLLWPGVVLRAVTVSNASLELLLGMGLALASWVVWERRNARWLPALALLLGAGMLTRLALVAFAPVVAVVAFDLLRRATTPARALAAGAGLAAIPLLVLAPWLAHNWDVYGALTGESAIRALQEPLLNPKGTQFGFGEFTDGVRGLSRAVVPDEWWVKFLSAPWRIAGYLLAIAFIAVVALGLARLPRERAARLATIGVVPVLATLAWITYALFVGNWNFFLPRYLYPELAVLGVVAAVCVRALGGARWVLGSAAGLTVALAALWLYLATSVTPFTG